MSKSVVGRAFYRDLCNITRYILNVFSFKMTTISWNVAEHPVKYYEVQAFLFLSFRTERLVSMLCRCFFSLLSRSLARSLSASQYVYRYVYQLGRSFIIVILCSRRVLERSFALSVFFTFYRFKCVCQMILYTIETSFTQGVRCTRQLYRFECTVHTRFIV